MSKNEDTQKTNDNTKIDTTMKYKKPKIATNMNNHKTMDNDNKWTKLLLDYFTTINSIDNLIEIIRSKLNYQNNYSSLQLIFLIENQKNF